MVNMSKNKTKTQYVDNKKFFSEIVEHKKKIDQAIRDEKELPRIPEYIGKCILLIAIGISRRPKFMNYSFKDEMISDGIENCMMYFNNFNPNITQNPFAYFSEIIHWAFVRRILKEKKNRYITYKYFQNQIDNSNEEYYQDDDGNNLISNKMYDNIDIFIVDFEEKEKQKIIQKRKKMKKAKAAKAKLNILDIED